MENIVAETRDRPRLGALQLMVERPGPMFYDSWAVCPGKHEGGLLSERDGAVWMDHANDCYRCQDGHIFDHRHAVWEVEGR